MLEIVETAVGRNPIYLLMKRSATNNMAYSWTMGEVAILSVIGVLYDFILQNSTKEPDSSQSYLLVECSATEGYDLFSTQANVTILSASGVLCDPPWDHSHGLS